ncbi:MAG: aminodeoxychorismate synthase component I, partial [Proteobacteria bacterium]|nr:aminodeoxychorismate synthase component I [Pseudomonadota bacterium]
VFFDSASEVGGRGRHAYIATDPADTLILDDIDGKGVGADPFERLRHLIGRTKVQPDPTLPPFQCGVAGLLGYGLGRSVERLPDPKPDGVPFPDLAVGLYDTIAAFDNFERKAWIVAVDIDPMRPSAIRRMTAMAEKIAAAPPLGPIDGAACQQIKWDMDATRHAAAVERTIDYIRAGDIFQANITGRATASVPADLSAWTLYRRLRWASPAPFAAFVGCGVGRTLLSASPERFLRLERDGRISTRPIKGTRPRGDDPETDAHLALELLESEKDRAENLMIVDLLRNDISRVAMIGSVKVTALCELETFASVHHLVSEVQGKLRPGCDAVDLFRASFPGGSVTGAPKIRAMQIIHELEPVRRGPYCGAVFWAGFDGGMDSSIIIRSLVFSDGVAAAHAGGGIVADSDPMAEYDEARLKAVPLIAALVGGPLKGRAA